VPQVHLIKWTPEGGSRVVPLDATEIEQELSYFSPAKPAAGSSSNGSSGSNGGGGQQPVAAAAGSASAAQDGVVQQQGEQQSPAGVGAAAGAAAGGAAGALMASLRAWLDHHHRSYAQELEAAALRGVREQLAAEQWQQQQQ
jgi:hypothetical protein